MKISILGSGSEGNATYVKIGDASFLIDAGFSAKTIIARLQSIDVDPSSIDAIVVTHEHNDHIRGVGVFSRKMNLPIYITPESYRASKDALGKIADENLCLFEGEFDVNGARFVPFDVNHDAARTVGFRVEGANGKCLALSTDIGCSNGIGDYFSNADVVVLEANYDLEMLQSCGYPYYLKQRINSPFGHLSNVDSGRLIGDMYHANLKKVYLAHVSKNSNTYDLALATVRQELESRGIDLCLEVARQESVTELFAI